MSLATLLTSTEPSAHALGQLLQEITTSLNAGTLTTQEYVTLMEDVERLRLVIRETHDLQLDQAAHEAVVGLIALASLLKVI